MPRAGGDYVWQSRVLDGIPGTLVGAVVGFITGYLVGGAVGFDQTFALVAGVGGLIVGGAIGWLNGGIGFVLAATGWWFILALWAPIYGFILKIEFFQPLAALLGSKDGVDFFGSQTGTLVVSLIVIILTSGLVALGMAGYARIQKWCLYLGLILLAIMFILMLVSSKADFKAAFDRQNQSMFAVSGAYDQTIADAAANDAFTGSLNPAEMGTDVGATVTATLAMIPFMLFWILYPNWGSTLYGEVRGSGDFRKVLRGMLARHLGHGRAGDRVRGPRRQDVRLAVLQRHERELHQLRLRVFDGCADGPDLELPAAPRVLPGQQLDLPDRVRPLVRGVVPRLVGDVVPVLDPDDLRGGLRPDPAGPRRSRFGATRRADHGPALHHDPVDRSERHLCVLR